MVDDGGGIRNEEAESEGLGGGGTNDTGTGRGGGVYVVEVGFCGDAGGGRVFLGVGRKDGCM